MTDAYKDIDIHNTDFRKHPELYRVGRGERGVLSVEPYKSELLPLWRFKTPEIARESSEALWEKFEEFLEQKDFVGADMAKKFLQMGWTRARRYANHKSGRKYDEETGEELPLDEDPVKAEAAAIFYKRYVQARENETYKALKEAHKERVASAQER